jgi:hypothetical protein
LLILTPDFLIPSPDDYLLPTKAIRPTLRIVAEALELTFPPRMRFPSLQLDAIHSVWADDRPPSRRF